MSRRGVARALLLALAAAGCGGLALAEAPRPVYRGVETRMLDGELVNFHATLIGTGVAQADEAAVAQYAACAAAQYALIRGYGFARHLRTATGQEDGVWRADAVYTISPALPRGLRTIDAEVTVADCAEQAIPTV